jgi:hypothetical protein
MDLPWPCFENTGLNEFMALMIMGKTECLICRQVIEKSEEHVAFPAFLKAGHRLQRYSDGVFHRRCFDASPDSEEVRRLYSRFRQIWAERPRNLKTAEEITKWGQSAFKELDA